MTERGMLLREMTAVAMAAAVAACGQAPPPATPAPESPIVTGIVTGIDHVPTAVADLEAAQARFRALGFTLKPGRPHDNGIRNAHAKFGDGASIELITATTGVDELTRTYRTLIAQGDGPAFLAWRAPDIDALARALAPLNTRVVRSEAMISFAVGDSMAPYFFGPGTPSRTDRPEHFVHPNSARGIAAVWLAPSDPVETLAMFARLGMRFTTARRCLEICLNAQVAKLGSTEIIVLDASRQRLAGRPVLGLTVRVQSLQAARTAMAGLPGGGLIDRRELGMLIVRPAAANGIWLAFSEAP
jgi:catechol 2,3-dioxygenase-like lactoylglutathione lyase family enzyme